MNDYQDLMDEYQEIKTEINEEYLNLSNASFRIKTFQLGIESFKNNLVLIQDKKMKSYENLDKSTFSFVNDLMKIKEYIDSEIIVPLNNLLESANIISKQNLDIFNEIKISLIQERQKLNKAKNDYYKFVSNNINQKFENEDENLLFKARKENYQQLYKYEVNQMNNIIDQNNIKYNKMYKDLWEWKEIQKIKINNFYVKFLKYVEKMGNLMIEFSKNILNDINKRKEFEVSSSLNNEKSKIKNPRFEKIEIEGILMEKKEKKKMKENKIIECKPPMILNYDNNFVTPMGSQSDSVVNNDFFDFDIMEKEEFDLKGFKNETISKSKKIKNDIKNVGLKLLNKINEKKNKLNINETKNINDSNIIPSSSSGFDDFEIVEQNSLLFQKNYKLQNEQFIKDIINKITSEEEILSQEIGNLMNLLKEEDPSTKKLYSYTFLSKLYQSKDKYIIILKNKTNFIHLSNILNNISIKQNKIDILKLIIEIAQIIAYKDKYLYNLLQKKNKFLSTKTFWSKIILDSFINDLNKQTKIILKEQNTNNEINKNKEKETSIYIIEFTNFSKQINNYKKLNPEQKRKLDKFARDNVKNVIINSIEGMCSFLVQKKIALEVIYEFGKLFGFSNEIMNYYELLIDVYMNRNYMYHLNKLSFDIKNDFFAKTTIICNAAKFLPREKLLNLIAIKKDMSEYIKKFIFINFLRKKKISIDERIRIWGLFLDLKKLKEQYNYEENKQRLFKLIENNEIPKGSSNFQNFGLIELDVNRTFFMNQKDTKKYQNFLKNILITLIYINKEIGYFQGMNYITAFFFQLFEYDEEKTFYFMLAIEKNTKFKELFNNNLYLLTSFFKVFEKVLKINAPEIYQHQIINEINPNYYLPPWFLTLFTFMCTKFERENAPKYILLVIESFFLNGWSAIFNAGYTIMKYLRNDIINLKEDALMNYMVNSFGNEILKEENFEIIQKEYIKNSDQINEELISKLLKANEYERISFTK